MPLQPSTAHGGGVDVDVLAAMKRAVPNATLYYWGSRAARFDGGKVHAKVAVAGRRPCWRSSANPAGLAMEKDMAAGGLFRGGQHPDAATRLSGGNGSGRDWLVVHALPDDSAWIATIDRKDW